MRRTHSTNLLDNKKSCAFFFLREILGYIHSFRLSSIAPFKLSVYNRLNFFKNTSLVMLWHPLTIHCIEIDTISTKIEEKTHFRNTTGSVTKAYVLLLLSEHFDLDQNMYIVQYQYVDQKRVLSGRLNAGHDNVGVLVDGNEGAVDVGVAGPLPVQGQAQQTTTTTPHHYSVIAL